MKNKKSTNSDLLNKINRLEQELKAEQLKNQRYDFLMQYISDFIWTFDIELNRFSYVSQTVEKLLGFTPEEYISIDFSTLVPSQTLPKLKKIIAERSADFIQTKQTKEYVYEIELYRKDGSLVWTEIRAFFQKNSITQKTEAIGFVRDISERKKAEDKILRNESLLNDLEKISHTGGWEYTVATQTMFWTDELYNIHEFRQDNSIDLIKESSQCYLPEDRQKILSAFNKCISKGIAYDFEFPFITYKKNKRWIRTKTHAILENGKVIKVLGLVTDITDKKLTEQALEESQERFKLAMQASKDGIFDWNLITNEIYYSPGWKKMLGYENHELENNFEIWEQLTKPEDVKKSWQMLNDHIQGKSERFEVEFKMHHKNGHWIDVLSRAIAHFDKTGKATRVVGTHVDISEQKKAEKQIKKEKKRSQHYLEIAGVMLIALDKNQNVTLINPKGCEILGYSHDEIIGKNWFNHFLPQEKKEKIKKIFNQIINGDIKPVEYYENVICRKNKDLRMIAWHNSVLRDETGEIIGLFSSGEDITEKTQAQEALRSEKEFTDMALNVQTDTFFLFEPATRKTVRWNRAFTQISGYTDEEVAVLPAPESYYSDNDLKQIRAFIKTVMNEGKGIIELDFICKDGTKVPTEYQISVIYDQQRKPKYLISIGRNISERKKTEKALKEQNEEYEALNEELRQTNSELLIAKEKAEESDHLKTEFLHNMSHEIRTPMNGILGFSEFLNMPDISQEKRKQYISIIQNCGQQLLKIIDDILEISRLETKQIKAQNKKICLNNLLVELFTIFDMKANENKIPLYLRKSLTDKESTILTDELKLTKILSNLLENSFKFTANGFIEFGYRLKNEKELEIYVKDTGIGIKSEMHQLIFERFSQEEKELSKKTGGLGLGLSIAKENAELLGGNISLISKKGEGATFLITIPYNPVYKTDTTQKLMQNTTENNQVRILLVEDVEVNILYIEEILKQIPDLNYTLFFAKNGLEAVEICRKNIDIDLVLMDIKMKQMNGYQATKEIRQMHPELPIIVQTAYSTIDAEIKAKEAGCSDFISKPIKQNKLQELIKKYLY